jgi:hypothetical protein
VTALQAEMFEVLRGFATSELPRMVRAAVRDVARELAIGDAQDVLCNAIEAARILGTTPAALRRAHERGRAPVAPIENRTGRRAVLRWRKRDLLAYIAASAKCDAG